jgi:hypothetical protein
MEVAMEIDKQMKLTMTTNLFYLLLILTTACNAQRTKDPSKTNKPHMEKFNKAKFDSNKVNGEYSFVLDDGTRVKQMENISGNEYVEEMTDPKKPFSKVRVYFMDSANIKVKGERFYLIPIGEWQYYNNNGSLIKETNWDSAYKFTINDLAKKVLKSEKIDIMKYQRGVDVLRSDISRPLYIVVFPFGPAKPYDIYSLVVDGITGETVEKTISSTKK